MSERPLSQEFLPNCCRSLLLQERWGFPVQPQARSMDRWTSELASIFSRTLECSVHWLNHIFDELHIGKLPAQTIVENFPHLGTVSKNTSGHGHGDTAGVRKHLINDILGQSDQLFCRLSQNLARLLVLLFCRF